ncbi:MAG TPA: AmmeMemoRadiSam system protein A [Phycisphaerae bacterium]|nr:AmmeMemoRadiSam system protein A [Phycisphaerae bacterium]
MTISPEDRAKLVALARQAVEAQVNGHPRPTVRDAEGIVGEKRGCFVTLTNSGRLRGCIGTFHPTDPLGEMIVQMGASAARDPRFVTDPVTPEEIPQLTIEVSVLSKLEKTRHPEQLQIGRDGIYIVCGGRSGCFLPEVATDQGWSAEEFLNYCCAHKAGLSPDAWRFADAEVYIFTSEKFTECEK